MKIKSLTATLFLCTSLSACSIMNEQECQTANWSALGYLDGSQGVTVNQFNERNSACSKYAVRANFNEYKTGYTQGLTKYCTESNGFFVGSQGNSYQGVCTPTTANKFLKGYRHGQQLFTLKNKVSQAEQALTDEQYALEHQQQTLNDLKNSLIYDQLTPYQRRQKLEQIEDINNKPNKIRQKTKQLNHLKYQLQQLQKKLHINDN